MDGLARLWVAALALAAGSVAGLEQRPGWSAGLLAVLATVGLARRRSWATAASVAAAAFVLGWWGAALRAHASAPVEVLAAAVLRCEVRGQVIESAGGLGTLVSLHGVRCEGHGAVANAGVVITDAAGLDAGSYLRAEGWLLPLGETGFDRACERLGARARLNADTMSTRPPRTGPLAVAFALRRGLVGATGALARDRGALLRGLAVGDVSAIDELVIERFRRAGLSHLLAVSGSNVAIVLGAVAVVLRRLSPKVRVTVALAALGLFVLVVGPEPSVLRAAVMGAVGLAGLAWGRRAEPLHALALALIVVVALRPGLVASVGLHLSAAATAGIVLWARPLAARLSLLPRPAALGMGATLAAQVAVAPLLVATFGELSVAGPLANLLAMPAVPPATVAGLAAAAAGALHEPLGGLVARLGEPFVAWILWVGMSVGRAPWASVELPAWVGWLSGAPLAARAIASAASSSTSSGRHEA